MHPLGIVQWNSTRRDHPGNPGGVSGSGPVKLLVSNSLLSKRKMINTSFFSRQKVFPSTKLISLSDLFINFEKRMI